jgi:hypothetical protein
MESERVEPAAAGTRARPSLRGIELQRLGSRESALIREVRRRLRAHPLDYDERLPIDQDNRVGSRQP